MISGTDEQMHQNEQRFLEQIESSYHDEEKSSSRFKQVAAEEVNQEDCKFQEELRLKQYPVLGSFVPSHYQIYDQLPKSNLGLTKYDFESCINVEDFSKLRKLDFIDEDPHVKF
eukprot:snap_masked-scaffold_17-processed-gene-6.30-mRNA-1 protein AED:1.00 eAED:1.00 QI:0/0/0/0/1/1/2/0/113